ncbi:MAG TPA: radical SAM protein [Victivallales bacterium]|nr:radical SAM protein [Victivallales bacterium]
MKILLVAPSQSEIYGKITPPEHPHLGLLYVASVLERDGHDVTILDFDAEAMTLQSFAAFLTDMAPDMVGITSTTPTYANAIKIAEAVRNNSAAKRVAGGIHPTLMPLETMRDGFFDFVVKGEGEITMSELVKCIGSGGALSSVKGILYSAEGKIFENPDRPINDDLDELPFPTRKLLRNKRYRYPDALKTPAFPIITSRGCPGDCSFCTAKFVHGKRFRCRSAKNVVDEIEQLVNNDSAAEIHIWDDNFITNPKRVFEISDEIKKRKIKCLFAFPNGVRADFIRKDILSAMKEMGTYSIAIGVESGDQTILDSIRKGIAIEQISKAFAVAKEVGLETWGFFLLGLPGENLETIRKTINFAIELDPDIAKFHVLKPYPKSEVAEKLKKLGLIIDEDYVHYGIHTGPVHRLNDLSQSELTMLQKEAYRSFYMRPGKILKEIARLKTFNRMRLNFSAAVSILKDKILS